MYLKSSLLFLLGTACIVMRSTCLRTPQAGSMQRLMSVRPPQLSPRHASNSASRHSASRRTTSFPSTLSSTRGSPVRSLVTLAAAVSVAAASSDLGGGERGALNGTLSATACAPPSEVKEQEADPSNSGLHTVFPSHLLSLDSYNGVTIDLERWGEEPNDMPDAGFATLLSSSLRAWKQQGKRGVWITLRADQSDKVHAAVQQGFDFHMVVDDNKLILSKWLPEDSTSRLPRGPTHQVGVGCLIFHPDDPSRMLVVQEKTGPAAAMGLWKMPTGLADPMEDIHDAAVRELKEETDMDAQFDGILTFRQAHSTTTRVSGTTRRQNSDLFFVCQMKLLENECSDSYDTFRACPDEIAAIQWMPVRDYCSQERWSRSPVYQEMNKAILEASSHTSFAAHTFALGFAPGTNTLYKSQPSNKRSQL